MRKQHQRLAAALLFAGTFATGFVAGFGPGQSGQVKKAAAQSGSGSGSGGGSSGGGSGGQETECRCPGGKKCSCYLCKGAHDCKDACKGDEAGCRQGSGFCETTDNCQT
jgi:hypothetical protein